MAEPTEHFVANLMLLNNNGLSVTVNPALATVDISDDDSKLGNFGKREKVSVSEELKSWDPANRLVCAPKG